MPLPIAQLYVRGHNAKSHLERYLAAYYLWEASLKLLASTSIVEYAELNSHDPAIEERLQSLARPSTGHWWEYIKLLVPVLAKSGDQSFSEINELLFGRRRDDLPRAAALDAYLRQELEGKSSGRTTVKLSELFDRMVAFRNRELGHGATGQQNSAHYEKLGRTMLLAMEEILQRLDVLAGRRLLYFAEVRRSNSGEWNVERYSLASETMWRLEPLVIAAAQTNDVPAAEQIYLENVKSQESSGQSALLPLAQLRSVHPLLIYNSETSEVFFLNGRRGKTKADYLCYTSGNVVQRESFQATQQELLSRILHVPVKQEDLQAWSQQIVSEEPEAQAEVHAEDGSEKYLDEFQLLSLIGRGGMGEVYRAWQPSLGREVALKCLIRSGDANAEARFAREIRALGKVEHPHLVKIFTAGTYEDKCYYAMELIEGADLENVTRHLSGKKPGEIDNETWRSVLTNAFKDTRTGEKQLSTADNHPSPGSKLPLEAQDTAALASLQNKDYVAEVVEFIRQTALAAHALHEVGVVHRDIKPGNIMIDMRGKAVLMDLGLAKLALDSEGQLTRTRQFVGTICYASPEQVLSAGHLDLRSDVYSLGATLWELLALRPPFSGMTESSTFQVMRQIQQDDPEPLRNINPRVSRDLNAIVQKCMEKNPDARYQTAKQLADDLQRYQRDEPVNARHVGLAGRFLRRCKRRPAATAAWTSITLLSLIMIAASYLIFGKSSEKNVTEFQVAVETYPGSVNKWWFDEDNIAWNMLPLQRAKMSEAPDADYQALYDPEKVSKFVGDKVKTFEGLPEFEPFGTSTLVTAFRPRTDEQGKLIPETDGEKQNRINADNRVKLKDKCRQISSVEKNLELVNGVSGTAAEVFHTTALLNHKLVVLNKEAAGLQSKLSSDSGPPYEERAAKCGQEARDAFAQALEAYPANAPLKALCEFDEIQFLSEAERPLAAYKLYHLNKRLETEADQVPWTAGQAFRMFRLSALCKGGELCRKLAKENRTEQNSQSALTDYFQSSEQQYMEAQKLVTNLCETLPSDNNSDSVRKELADAKVHVMNQLGLVFMDQWKFGRAIEQFDNALAQLESAHSVASNDSSGKSGSSFVTLTESTPDTFHARMEYIKIRHRQAMVLCYTNYLSEAEKNFKEITEEMTAFLHPSVDRSENEKDEVRSLRSNSLERYSECLQTRKEKLAALATASQTSQEIASKSAIGYKRLITLALDETTLGEAVTELNRLELEESPDVPPGEAGLLRRIAQTIPMLHEERREAAVALLENELNQGIELANRESIVTRLLAWQLLAQYSADQKGSAEIFDKIKSIVRDRVRKQKEPFSSDCLDLYKNQIATPAI